MKILIADDETPIREWIQFSIERGNNPEFEISGVAENGDEAYEMALKYHVDTVITDIKMPGMDGLMLMKKLQEVMPYVDFIILTNYAEFSYAREAITYGAKKYFLKSELRGQDILEALMEIHEANKKTIEGKEEDCYSNGYLDIYSCCYHIKDKGFTADFWNRHHLKEDWPYLVMTVKNGDSRRQKQLIDGFSARQDVFILRPVLRNESIYLIVQALQEDKLYPFVKEFFEYWSASQNGIVVSGRVSIGVLQVMGSIEDAGKMLQYEFFYDKGFYSLEEMDKRKPLDREKIKKQYRKVLSGLLYEEREELRNKVEEWFDFMENISFCDVDWAREMCIKFAMRIEENLFEKILSGQEEHEPEQNWTLEKSRKFCFDLLERLYSENNNSYSQSVRQALCYIHQNYARQDISLLEAAQTIYRSPEYLSRIFKAETGKNFSTYLMMYRLFQAKNLLLHTDMKVYEIADAVGYTSHSYFSRVYHEYMGMTPEAVRNQKSDNMSE